MAYENLCMYCFEDMEGQTTCPHCGRDSRAAVPQIQMLPGSRIYHERFLIGRALGQDSAGIVYAAFDTKKENRLRIREYMPRDCAERLNDGAVVPIAGMEDQFEAGIKKLRASVESVEDPRKRHFFFEENGTAYIAQRKSASASTARESEREEEEETGNKGRVLLFAGIAVAVLLVAAVLLITMFNGAVSNKRDITQSPTLDPSQVWIPATTPTATPYVAPTFAALVDPELSWMDYTYDGDVEREYQQAQVAAATPAPTTNTTQKKNYTLINAGSSKTEIRGLQQKLSELGWLDDSQVTGQYDAATRQAVRDFQSYINEHYKPKQKLSVDGAAGPKTQQWLYEAYAPKPTPTPKPKVTPKPDDGTVDESSSTSQVRAMQQKLITLGLLPASAADGKYGATTAAAVRRFQTRINQLSGYDVLEVSGKMDAQSMAFLNYYVEEWERLRKATAEPTAVPKPTAKPTATPTTRPVEVMDGVIDANASKEDIRKVQQLLVDIGMLSKKGVDGVYGSGTISAVADFQQWVNTQRKEQTLTVNGEVDQLTLLYLQYCKDHGMMPYGTPAPKATKKPTAEPTLIPVEPKEEYDPGEPDELEEDEGSQEIEVGEDSDPESIRYVQEMLSAIGAMDADGIDGVYGKGTVRAVENFQRWVNSVQGEGTLAVTGKVDNRTRIALEYAYDHELQMTLVTAAPTEAPTAAPTEVPTAAPTEAPTAEPTEAPTAVPTAVPTEVPTAEPTEEPEEEPGEDQEVTVGEGSETESIQYAQEMLNAVGVLGAGDMSGEYDDATVAAVRDFQAWVNSLRGEGTLPVNGQLDSNTLKYLEYAADPDLRAVKQQAAPTEAPAEEPEDEPEEEPEEEPGVGEVGDIAIRFGDEDAEDGVVTLPEGKVTVSWRAEGDVEGYLFYVEDSSGNTSGSPETTRDTSFTIDSSRMKPGEVYTLRLGVVPKNGGRDDVVWRTARFTLPEPEVTPEPEPEVGVVSVPEISIAGVSAGSSTIVVEDDSFQISWSASGDLDSYYVRLTDSSGNDVQEPQYTTRTSATLRTAGMEEDEVYTLMVGAVPLNGSQDDMQVSRAQFMRAAAPTPLPTEVPTPAPQVATIGKPVINVGGSAYQQDGISYMTDSSIIVSWSADGDVESYAVYVENQNGERQELGTTTDTSRTVSTHSLPAGIYTVYVGALPRGGSSDDVVWGSTRFGIPAPPEPEEEPYEEPDDDEPYEEPDEEDIPEEDLPEDEPEGEAEAMSVSGPIDSDSDFETVQRLQLKLYSLGYLSPDVEEGVLDEQTLQAVAEFQTRKNEKEDAGFDVVDPGDLSSVVDAATVRAIFES